MPRPKRNRTVCEPPGMQGFRPFGIHIHQLEQVVLAFDEYESLRLMDYENLNQAEAAERMNVSRPTLTRIYEQARKKVAQAFVEGKAILIRGGNVHFEHDWFRCQKCFKLQQSEAPPESCRSCENFSQLEWVNRQKKT